MNKKELFLHIQEKRSCLCVGLDSDIRRIPAHLLSGPDPVFEFNRQIIEATADFAVAYKPNIAFYEAQGPAGWESLAKTLAVIPDDIMVIADAKRGDIGNTSRLYARAFFENLNCEAITVAPYMGKDSVQPFLEYENHWVFVLALTSNPGAEDFQWTRDEEETLYQKVVRRSQEWAAESPGELGYVVGATRPEYLAEIRSLAPEAFFLVPGVGAQGGDLESVMHHGLNDQCGLLINSSRGIIFASGGEDFAKAARGKAQALQLQMEQILKAKGLV